MQSFNIFRFFITFNFKLIYYCDFVLYIIMLWYASLLWPWDKDVALDHECPSAVNTTSHLTMRRRREEKPDQLIYFFFLSYQTVRKNQNYVTMLIGICKQSNKEKFYFHSEYLFKKTGRSIFRIHIHVYALGGLLDWKL